MAIQARPLQQRRYFRGKLKALDGGFLFVGSFGRAKGMNSGGAHREYAGESYGAEPGMFEMKLPHVGSTNREAVLFLLYAKACAH